MSSDDTNHDHAAAAPNTERMHWYDKTQVPADASGQWTWQWDDIAPRKLLDEWARMGAQVDQDLASDHQRPADGSTTRDSRITEPTVTSGVDEQQVREQLRAGELSPAEAAELVPEWAPYLAPFHAHETTAPVRANELDQAERDELASLRRMSTSALIASRAMSTSFTDLNKQAEARQMKFLNLFRDSRRDDSKTATQMDSVEAVTVNTPGRFQDEIAARYHLAGGQEAYEPALAEGIPMTDADLATDLQDDLDSASEPWAGLSDSAELAEDLDRASGYTTAYWAQVGTPEFEAMVHGVPEDKPRFISELTAEELAELDMEDGDVLD